MSRERFVCWLFGHDWLTTVCGFGLHDHYRDCHRCRRREWDSDAGWVEERPANWAPVTDPNRAWWSSASPREDVK